MRDRVYASQRPTLARTRLRLPCGSLGFTEPRSSTVDTSRQAYRIPVLTHISLKPRFFALRALLVWLTLRFTSHNMQAQAKTERHRGSIIASLPGDSRGISGPGLDVRLEANEAS